VKSSDGRSVELEGGTMIMLWVPCHTVIVNRLKW
jgi:hypothetical protein